MGLYRDITHLLEQWIIGIEIYKNKYSEKKAIRKKRLLYNNVQWSDEERKSFEAYWISHYGKPFMDSWHKLYQSVNGTFDEKYFPDYLYSTEVEWRINPKAYCDVLSDKNLLSVLYYIDHLHIPFTHVSCANGVFQDSTKRVITEKEAISIVSNIGKAVIKPTVDSGSGHNVIVVSMQDGIDTRSGESIRQFWHKYNRNFVVQELISPCDEISTLSPNALSTFRVITYRTDKGFFTAPLSMRVGTGSSDVDNIHAGGLVIGVNKDGTLKKYAYLLGYGDRNEKVAMHPDSGISFEGYKIPMVPEMQEIAIKLHERIPQLGMVSWDLTIDNQKRVTLIEVNTRDQAVWFPQMVNGESIFGDNTPFFLEMINKNKR